MDHATVDAAQGPYLLDVRRLDGPEKHPTIHEMFDDLEPGQALTIVNDHQPKPLFYELEAERVESFDAENYRAYEAAGPTHGTASATTTGASLHAVRPLGIVSPPCLQRLA